MSTSEILPCRRARPLAALLLAVTIAAGCSGSEDAVAEAPSTARAVVTTSDVTADGATTTGLADATTSTESTSSAPTPSGSGCSPGTSSTEDGLPDGRWFVYIGPVAEAAGPASLTLDLACWFTGDDAALAAAEDGDESPPPNDYHVRNDNDLLRVQPVAADAQVSWIPEPGDPGSAETIPYLDWLGRRLDRPFQPGTWIVIEDGDVVEIEEQFVP